MRGVWVAMMVGCYHPTAAPDVPCASNGHCPDGQSCDFSQNPPTCIVGDAGVSADAPPPLDGPVLACGSGCPADQPICDPATQTCRGCAADADCPDDVCIESTGACVAAPNALYVAPTGDDTGNCTQMAPCATISGALAHLSQGRRTIKVADGSYTDAFLISNTAPIVISGEHASPMSATVAFAPMGFGGTMLDHSIEDVASSLTVEGLTFSGATNEIARVSNGGQLSLFAVRLDGGTGGLDCNNSTAVLAGAIAINSTGIGVSASGAAPKLTIHRSLIANNDGVGLSAKNANFDVTNTMIVSNGAGGVSVATPVSGHLGFDTIAQNAAGVAMPGAAVACDVAFPIDDTILAENGAPPQIADTCAATYSLFTDTASNGAGNIVGSARFVSVFNGDFHIMPGSSARNAADPAATLAVDFDGEVRPQGMNRDIGADEIP